MELWHALNLGVDGRHIFMDDTDRARFVHDLFEFNDEKPSNNDRRLSSMIELRTQSSVLSAQRTRLVNLHAWCIMHDHYHLVLTECAEGGLSRFLRKLNIGYAMYFNERHHRRGTLFSGRTKKVPIQRHAHFLYILHYVHLNPLDYLPGAEKWRVRNGTSILDANAALAYLDGYRWSSYLDFIGRKNFPSLLTKGVFAGRPTAYAAELQEYMRDAEASTASLGPLALE